MKLLSKKEAGFYNNKLLVISVLVLMIGGLAWVVIATVFSAEITLDNPADNTVDWVGGNRTFNCTIENVESGTSGNVSIWHNFSGTWHRNKTREWAASDLTDELNFVINLSTVSDFENGIWNCEVNTTGEADHNFSAANYTFHLDTTAPTAFFLNNSATISNATVQTSTNSSVLLNWTGTAETHFQNYTVYVYNSSNYADANLTAMNMTYLNSTTNITVSPLLWDTFPDDTYYWFVTAYENSSGGRATNSTQKWEFIIDTDFGNVTLNFPENNTWDDDGSVLFNYTVSDNNVDTCIIYYNITGYPFITGESNSSLSDGITVTNTTALSDGNYTWYVWCNDTGGHQENSSQQIFKMDNTNPIVGLDNPLNASYDTDGVVYFNFTTTETYPGSCQLWHNESGWKLNQTSSYTSGTQEQFTNPVTFNNEGRYLWNVNCSDSAGNWAFNATNFTLFIDTAGPTLSLIAPADNLYSSSSTASFNYTANDTFLDSCTLYGNFSGTWQANQTNSTLTQISQNIINQTITLGDGEYIWNALCNDSASTANTSHPTWLRSTNYTITVDTTPPTEPGMEPGMGYVLLGGVYYGNNTLGSDSTPTVNWTSVTETNFRNYTIEFSNSSGFVNPLNATEYQTNRTNTTATVSIEQNLSDATTYYWRVTAYDLAGNSNTSGWFNYTTDITDPAISIGSPITSRAAGISTRSASASVTFRYNMTDTNADSCVLWANFSGGWAVNNTNNSITTNINDTFSVTLGNGTYIWNLWCNDSAAPANSVWLNSTGNFTLIVDTAVPTIATSLNATTTSTRVITFNITANSVTAINQSAISISPSNASSSNFNYSTDCTSSDGNFTFICSYIETGLTAGTGGVKANILSIGADTDSGVSATTYDLYINPSAANNFTIALKSGWNLISTPLVLENTGMDNMIANNSNIDTIYWYNNSGSTYNVWYSSDSYTDTLTTMEPRKGYWVNATANTNIYLFGRYNPVGVPSSYDALTLATGWHTIGHYKTAQSDGFNTSQVLGNLVTLGYYDFSSLSYWNATKQESVSATQSRDVIATAGYAIDSLWYRGRAFWIYMTTSGNYLGQ